MLRLVGNKLNNEVVNGLRMTFWICLVWKHYFGFVAEKVSI